MKKIYLLFLVIIMIGCEQQELPLQQEAHLPNQMKPSLEEIYFQELSKPIYEYLENYNYREYDKSKSILPFGKIRTDIPAKKLISKEGKVSYTLFLDTVENISSNYPSTFYFDNLVYHQNYNEEGIMYVIRYIPTNDWYNFSKDFSKFSGRIEFFYPTGEKISHIELIEGDRYDNEITKSNRKVKCALEVKKTYSLCSEVYDAEGSLGPERCVTVVEYRWNCSIGGDNGDGGGGSDDSSGPINREIPIDGGATAPILILPEEDDNINTDNLNNDCVEGIIEELKKKDSHFSVVADPEGNVSHLSQIMLNMFEKSSKYHLEFNIADATDKNGNPRNAVTETANTPLGVTFTITLDDDYVVNATQLAIARTIVHETLHGYLKYINQEYPTSDLSQLIYKYYRDNNGDPNKTHHEVMTLFAEAMGASLAAWDNHNIPPPLDPTRLNYYEALSFSGGMIKSTSFSQLHSDDQDLIKLANKQEGNAVSPAESSAKSSKCP